MSANTAPNSAPSQVAPDRTLPKGYDEHFIDSVLDKQGGRCFGCCCDYKRAVILINILIILANGAAVGIYGSNLARQWNYPETTDDAVIQTYEDTLIVGTVLSAVSILFAIGAWIGAATYNRCLVILNILWLTVVYVARVVTMVLAYKGIWNGDEAVDEAVDVLGKEGVIVTSVVSGVITALILYPHIAFTREVKVGIMTKETYKREKRACIC